MLSGCSIARPATDPHRRVRRALAGMEASAAPAVRSGGIEWIGADGTAWCTLGRQRGLAHTTTCSSARAAGDARRATGLATVCTTPILHRLGGATVGRRLRQLPGPNWGWTTRRSPNSSATRNCTSRRGSATLRRAIGAADAGADPQGCWTGGGTTGKFYCRASENWPRSARSRSTCRAGMIGGPNWSRTAAHFRGEHIAAALLRVASTPPLSGRPATHVLLRPERVCLSSTSAAAPRTRDQPDDGRRPYFQTSAVQAACSFTSRGSPHRVVRPEGPSSPATPGWSPRWCLGDQTADDSSTVWPRWTPVMVDGGWLLPMGRRSNPRSRGRLRSLPSIRFQPVGNQQASEADSGHLRSGVHGGRSTSTPSTTPLRHTARVHVERSTCRLRVDARGRSRR